MKDVAPAQEPGEEQNDNRTGPPVTGFLQEGTKQLRFSRSQWLLRAVQKIGSKLRVKVKEDLDAS